MMMRWNNHLIKAIFAVMLSTMTVSCVKEVKKDTEVSPYGTFEHVDIKPAVEEKFNRSVVLLKEEKYDDAIALLEEVIAVEKRVAAPYVNLGMAYNLKGDEEQAEKNLMNAVNIELDHPVANNQLGLLYRKQGRFDDARKAYTNALTRYPDYLPVIKNLGILCELYIRDLPCALEQYEHYQSLKPDDKTMTNWIADLSRRVGR